MAGQPKDPLRALTATEHTCLAQLSRAHTAPAAHVVRAKALLAVASGASYAAAARTAGRRSGDAVAHLVARFNRDGLAALEPGHGGGQPKRYTATEQERILQEVRREPTPFSWGGKRQARRVRARQRRHDAGGSGAWTRHPLSRRQPKGGNGYDQHK